jgi:hypothetical protein
MKTYCNAFPKFEAIVWGSWQDVIALREYRDVLLEQKPCDGLGECDDYEPYRLCSGDAEGIAKAILAAKAAGLDCHIRCEVTSPFGNVEVRASTANPYSPADGPIASVGIDANAICGEMGEAVRKAVDILQRVDVKGGE